MRNTGIVFTATTVALFLILAALRIAGVIAWSWWWVAAPLWVPLAVSIAICVACLALAGLFVKSIER